MLLLLFASIFLTAKSNSAEKWSLYKDATYQKEIIKRYAKRHALAGLYSGMFTGIYAWIDSLDGKNENWSKSDYFRLWFFMTVFFSGTRIENTLDIL